MNYTVPGSKIRSRSQDIITAVLIIFKAAGVFVSIITAVAVVLLDLDYSQITQYFKWILLAYIGFYIGSCVAMYQFAYKIWWFEDSALEWEYYFEQQQQQQRPIAIYKNGKPIEYLR